METIAGKAIYSLGLCGVLFLAGCIGPGDAWVVKPRLNIEGRVVDKDGKGIANQELDLIVPQIYCDRATALRDASAPLSELKHPMAATVKTDHNGCFTHEFPEWERFEPSVVFFVAAIPFNTGIFMIVRESRENGNAYLMRVVGGRVKTYSLVGPVDDRREFRKSDETKALSASTKRDKKRERDIRFTLVQE